MCPSFPNSCLNAKEGDGSCNGVTSTRILSCMPWISIQKIYCRLYFTWGAFRSDNGILGPVVSKLNAYSGENLLICAENVFCCCDLDRGKTDLVDVFWVVLHLCIYQIHRGVCTTFEKFQMFLWPWNNIKVKLMTCKKRYCHCVSCV